LIIGYDFTKLPSWFGGPVLGHGVDGYFLAVVHNDYEIAEFAGLELTDEIAGVEIAALEIDGLEFDGLELNGLELDGLEIAELDSRKSNNRIQEWNLSSSSSTSRRDETQVLKQNFRAAYNH